MGGMKHVAVALALTIAAVSLWACDKGANAPARSHADEGSSGSRSFDGGSAPQNSSGGGYNDHADNSRSNAYPREETPREPVPLVDGKPMWSDNRSHTAAENADYHFHHDGPDFGVASEKDYVEKAHQFIEHPPADVQTISRSNGDKLLYDAKSNTFAVERKDGAPRTMFKPHAGEAYWKEQQAKAASGEDSYGGRRYQRSGSSGDAG